MPSCVTGASGPKLPSSGAVVASSLELDGVDSSSDVEICEFHFPPTVCACVPMRVAMSIYLTVIAVIKFSCGTCVLIETRAVYLSLSFLSYCCLFITSYRSYRCLHITQLLLFIYHAVIVVYLSRSYRCLFITQLSLFIYHAVIDHLLTLQLSGFLVAYVIRLLVTLTALVMTSRLCSLMRKIPLRKARPSSSAPTRSGQIAERFHRATPHPRRRPEVPRFVSPGFLILL